MRRNHFCELSFIARRPKSLRERGTQRGILIFFCGLLFMAGTSQKPTPTWRAKKCEAKKTRKPWSILIFFLIHLHSQNLPRKPYGVSSFFCESTFPRGTSPENCVAFQVFFVSRPSHPQPSQKTVWHVKFFCELTLATRTFPENHVACQLLLRVDLRNKNLPRKPCGVSILFCESTFAPRTFPENHVAFQIFFCGSTFAPQNRPREPCGISSFLCESTFHLEPSQKTIWRFTVFLRIDLPAKNLPIWRFNFVESTFTTRTFPENHAAFQFFWVDLRTLKPPKP